MKLKKLRIETHGGLTWYIPIGGGQHGADIYLDAISVPTGQRRDAAARAKVVEHIDSFIPKSRKA